MTSLDSLYEQKKPTAKKVSKLFEASPSNDHKRDCLSHLKRFVKSLDVNILGLFLQFVTGSNIITVENIKVEFSTDSGAACRPIAHTWATSHYSCHSSVL